MTKALRALFLLLAFSLAATAQAAERRKVIVDQDAFEGPGLQPILMLLQDPTVDVLGITIVSGDGWAPEEVAQTLRMLELIGRTEVPVIQGAIHPLINSKARNTAREGQYGALGYRGAWTESWPGDNTMKRAPFHDPKVVPPMEIGLPKIAARPGSAADFLIDMTRKYPGQVTIIAMGPLTNLALAQRLDDDFAGRVKELVMEGGFFGSTSTRDEFATQVAYAPRLSFNHFWDPEASHIVFTSPWQTLTLVTGDSSAPTRAGADLLARATASKRPVARYVARTAQPGFPLWDEVEAAAWLDPTIVTQRGTLAMDVDLMPGANYGALLTWPAGKGPGLGERDVNLIYAIDVPKIEAMFVDLIGR
ncbi:nucleoside hydrolase [Sphingomonas crocodyli]|uniref:Nucleoside hydrolase n=1 Tax=Sphingomonas crocodyli TaxID=1979270 RepID=A0A437M8U1_9SPHN|nr:nucleoside hydrolase [Sphingomonas crocodyli]RVT93996.1 nucleoside hydrolase [Sphingomonas crocodyli]